MTDKETGDGEKRNRPLLKQVLYAMLSAVSAFVASLTVELTGSEASNTSIGQTIGHILLIALIVAVPVGVVSLGVWGVLALRKSRRERAKPEVVEDNPPDRPTVPAAWFPPEPLCGREQEVAQAVSRVLETGVVAVVGARDVGTSTVASAVVQQLIERHRGEAGHTFRFDVRSRSTKLPYDATSTAGRVVSAFGIDEPSDDTGDVLSRAANQLIDMLAEQGGILLLDNVSTAEQVWWLVREWPSGGWPRLVIAGEAAVGAAVEHRTVQVGELAKADLRAIWDRELDVPEPGRRQRILNKLSRPKRDAADPVDELLRACYGRPRAVKAFTHEIRSTSTVTAANLAAEIRRGKRADGPLERVWTAILASIWDGLSEDAARLLEALAALPVTGLNRGAIAAVLGTEDLAPLEELRDRNLVREKGGRYRLPQEIRRPIVDTWSPEQRDETALRAVPALVGYVAVHVERWAGRLGKDLDTETERARDWFRDSEPTLRSLFGGDYYPGEVLDRVLADLCAIADALDTWYVREQRSRSLLEVNLVLHDLVRRARRPDLVALTAIRLATAHRLAGRPDAAAKQLDDARERRTLVRDDRIRAELDTRVQVEVALLAMTGAGPDDAVLRDAAAELGRLRQQSKDVARRPEVLVDLGALCLGRQRTAEALAHLKEAEALAVQVRDAGSEAHAVELQGVALAQQDGQLVEAARRWTRARARYERIGEDRGVARCLQHLGSAALHDPRVAGFLRYGRPVALPPDDAARVALDRLTQARSLRAGQPDTTLVDHYLAEARRRLNPAR
jgi:tetratricopeptide (TPR) repeat protein